MLAQVDGLPMPLFSSSFTSEASVNLAGGLVECSLESSWLH